MARPAFQCVVRKHYVCLNKNQMKLCEPVFIRQSAPDLCYGDIPQIQKLTNISYEILRTWRGKLLRNTTWRPYRALGVTTLPKEAEDELSHYI